MARPGRPGQGDEEREIRERMAKNRRKVVSLVADFVRRKRLLTARDYALVAAKVLHTLACGTGSQKERCRPLVTELRKYAEANGPLGWDKDTDFLGVFIRTHFPGVELWNCIDDATGPERHERNINEMAEMRRHSRALRERFVTARNPDPTALRHLRLVKPRDPTTWPTLRELKIATALSERTIKSILANLRPKPSNGEIKKLPLRHAFTTRGYGNKRGGLPNRYHPRLVLAVINVFVRDLADYPIGDEERKRFREVAMTAKRTLTQKLATSASST